jgi:hypothetical protein
MIPWTHLGLAKIPNNGGELELTQRDKEFSIHLKGVRGELMNSRMHSSEDALADLGCAHIKQTENAKAVNIQFIWLKKCNLKARPAIDRLPF